MSEAVSSEEAPVVKPKLFSVAWFKNLASALNFKSYDSRSWAIWHLSSWATWAQVLGIKVVWTWFVGFLPASVVAASKSFFGAVSAFFAALGALLFG